MSNRAGMVPTHSISHSARHPGRHPTTGRRPGRIVGDCVNVAPKVGTHGLGGAMARAAGASLLPASATRPACPRLVFPVGTHIMGCVNAAGRVFPRRNDGGERVFLLSSRTDPSAHGRPFGHRGAPGLSRIAWPCGGLFPFLPARGTPRQGIDALAGRFLPPCPDAYSPVSGASTPPVGVLVHLPRRERWRASRVLDCLAVTPPARYDTPSGVRDAYIPVSGASTPPVGFLESFPGGNDGGRAGALSIAGRDPVSAPPHPVRCAGRIPVAERVNAAPVRPVIPVRGTMAG